MSDRRSATFSLKFLSVRWWCSMAQLLLPSKWPQFSSLSGCPSLCQGKSWNACLTPMCGASCSFVNMLIWVCPCIFSAHLRSLSSQEIVACWYNIFWHQERSVTLSCPILSYLINPNASPAMIIGPKDQHPGVLKKPKQMYPFHLKTTSVVTCVSQVSNHSLQQSDNLSWEKQILCSTCFEGQNHYWDSSLQMDGNTRPSSKSVVTNSIPL